MAMRSFLFPLAFVLAACAPGAREPGPATGEPAVPVFATQLDAPAPDYGRLLADPPIPPRGTLTRDATAPLPQDARAQGQRWLDRLKAADALSGWGLAGKGEDGPVSLIDTTWPVRSQSHFTVIRVRPCGSHSSAWRRFSPTAPVIVCALPITPSRLPWAASHLSAVFGPHLVTPGILSTESPMSVR